MTLRWGLIGLGDISNKRIAPAILQNAGSALSAVMSPFPQEAEGFAQKFGVKKIYTELTELLADGELDALYIATPVYTHYELARSALAARRHVVVEKPMAMRDGECEELISLSRQNGVKLAVAYYRRFFPKIAEVKRLLAEGVIGEVVRVNIEYRSFYNPDSRDPKAWRVKKSMAGGGPLWDMGCHKFDLLIDLLGEPESVSALMSTLTHAYEVEDSCSALLQLRGGAHCAASFHWNSGTWTDRFELIGTRGRIALLPCDGDGIEVELPPRVMRGMGSELTRIAKPNPENVHAPVIADFAESVRDNRAPLVSGEEGYKTNKILSAIERSAAEQRKIRI